MITKTARTMPKQKPGQSRQDYGTPRDLLAAITARFGRIDVDLAASAHNAKAPRFYTKKDDTLSIFWAKRHPRATMFLNPEFGDARLYAEKCAYEGELLRGGKILLLVPASVGSDWYRHFVAPFAIVFPLSPRIIFEGETAPYPKDVVLALYGAGVTGFTPWRWK